MIAMDAQAGGGGARFTAVAAKVRVCAELGDHERAAVVAASEADRDHDAVCSAYGAAVHRHSAEALDLLRESTRKSGSLVVANNTGVVQASEGKWALAVVSFGAAIVANRHTQSALVPRPAHLYSADRRAELCYNYGVALLRSGRPARAHAVLATEACIVRGRAPIYWLRLAEACCAAVAVAAGSTKHNLQEVGRGRFRRLVVPGAGTGGGGASMGEEGGSDQGTLGAARVYLDHGVGLVEAGGDQAPLGVAIYALRAFVALGLDDPEVALWAGREALARVREAQHLAFSLPPRLVYAAHLYVVEAMCRLGRAVEADKVIGPAESLVGFIEGLTAEDDGGGLGSARGVFYVNLACCRLLQGRLDDAQAAAARANDADPGSQLPVVLEVWCGLVELWVEALQAARAARRAPGSNIPSPSLSFFFF